MLVRGFVNTCQNAYVYLNRSDRPETDGRLSPMPIDDRSAGASSPIPAVSFQGSAVGTVASRPNLLDVDSAISGSQRLQSRSAPSSPSPAVRRLPTAAAGYRTRTENSGDTKSEESRGLACGSGTVNQATGQGHGPCQLTRQLFSRVDRLLDGSEADRKMAFDLLEEQRHQLSGNANYLWRMAKAVYFQSKQETVNSSEERRRCLAVRSRDLAEAAVKLDPASPNAYKWLAITSGSVAEFEGVNARIEAGYSFKKYIEKSIELNPQDPTTHYLMGRWCYGVSKLTWVERKVASTLFAKPPTATVDDALKHFQEADRLHSGMFKENLLYLGICYLEKGDQQTGIRYLHRASRVPIQAADDESAQKQVESLLRKHAPALQ